MSSRPSRYAGMQDCGDSEDDGDAVDEQIEGGKSDDFVDMVDNFDDMDDDLGDDDLDLSIVSNGGQNEDDDRFDMVIGSLEDIMMDEKFQDLQGQFVEQYCSSFDDDEENKLIYTEIFSKYTQLIEGYVEAKLKEAIPDFSMQSFMETLASREEEMQSTDVFDMLVSFADFDTFKEIMLSHKHQREGKGVNLSVEISTVALHHNEQEDGDEVPDLNLSITPMSVSSPNGKVCL